MTTDSHFKCGLHRLNMDDQLKRNDLASCGTCKNNFILPDDSSSFVDGELYNRAPCSQDDFLKTYQYAPPKKPGIDERIKNICSCSRTKIGKHVKRRLPLLSWLPKYNFKKDLFSDILAGITLAVVQIPQAMAFTMLSTASPVLGIYATFFSTAVYFFLGTSKFSSLGMAGVTALVVGKAITDQVNKVQDMTNGNITTTFTDDDIDVLKTQVAATMAFIVGIFQITMGLLDLGSLALLFSEVMIRACQMAAVLQMIIGQIPHLLGLNIRTKGGILAAVYNFIEICKSVPETNFATLIISVVSIVTLVVINECINARYKHKLKIPVPTEIILIIIGTAVSYYVGLNAEYNVRILNHIPTGLPNASPPRFDLILELMTDSIVVTVLTFTIIMSQAKVLSSKYNCHPDISQELFANGVSNIIGSFFSSLPCSFAFVRCMLLIQLGARSVVCSIVCAGTLLLVLLFMAPLFQPLPYSILASIIVVALAEILLDLKLIKTTWKSVKTDAILIMASFLAVFLLDLQIGIGIGVVVSMIMVVFRSIRIKITPLGHVDDTDIYLDAKKYKSARELEGIKIFRIGGALFFSTKDKLKRKVDKLLKSVSDSRTKGDTSSIATSTILNISTLVANEVVSSGLKDSEIVQNPPPSYAVIFDFSSVIFVDTPALRQIAIIKEDMNKLDVIMYLAGCSMSVLRTIEKSGLVPGIKDNIYPTVHDAVLAAQIKLGPSRHLDVNQRHAYDNQSFIPNQ